MSTLHAYRRALRGRFAAARGDSGVGRRTADDRGMTAIEFVFLTPIIFGVIFLTVQFAMYYFAAHVAQAAARAGAREARAQAAVHDDWQDRARAKADGYIDQLGGSLLTSHEVGVRRDGDNVSVEVVGHVPSILGIGITVDERSQGPIERFVQGG
ncbi:pilus assembly protein [Streptomyces cocklensis]|jgi:Flp pilus assembly protein TadG|uniref:Flp pilus assembly protein TadG n=1 Tax=Actinacidiphila cocklensis TaxID=887465 RepID=A0A9W4DTW7_9ACTN|nr:TadE/TadG family type IV pilus assembly protein [Actinacidiphila cocklensis]MDD1057485.1 pilus assembly protein [Actinacidiphila cocklensis]WSX78990.1 pilus assembly protein [Streptomyces sp. NBC_00899]CAG6393897.1 Flp pilus assembly protein TadG [Actinacidiphila cocklensis]